MWSREKSALLSVYLLPRIQKLKVKSVSSVHLPLHLLLLLEPEISLVWELLLRLAARGLFSGAGWLVFLALQPNIVSLWSQLSIVSKQKMAVCRAALCMRWNVDYIWNGWHCSSPSSVDLPPLESDVLLRLMRSLRYVTRTWIFRLHLSELQLLLWLHLLSLAVSNQSLLYAKSWFLLWHSFMCLDVWLFWELIMILLFLLSKRSAIWRLHLALLPVVW